MEPVQLISLFLALYLLLHILGVWFAIKRLRNTFKAEKLAQKYGNDLSKSHGEDYNIRYEIRNKVPMYILCILFSWLTYSSMKELNTERKDDDVKS